MRALAFKIVSQLSAWIILLFQSVGNTGARVTGKIGYALMAVIDNKKLSLYEDYCKKHDQPHQRNGHSPGRCHLANEHIYNKDIG